MIFKVFTVFCYGEVCFESFSAQLAYNFHYGEFSEEQQEAITDTLRELFCYRHSRVWKIYVLACK